MGKISYSAVVLDASSVTKIKNWIGEDFNGSEWELIAHHATICLGELPQHMKHRIGEVVTLTGFMFGSSDKAMAIEVEGIESKNKIPHITIAINRETGGKPVDSNKITNWKKIKMFDVTGVITEVEYP